ncbi:MAG: hypothetical protein KF768_14520 [Phycisphaeraceae bacterium]|nr:hypothetical protein [Phycisphaeraceae bacterium]
MTTHDHNDHADHLLDANLREFGAIAAHDLPHDLSPEQLASFKAAPPATSHTLHRSPRTRSRVLFGLSSAAAAVILAVGVVLFPGAQPQQVSAATILDSLRARTITGVRMVINDARQDGVRLDGEFILHFRTPRTIEQLIDQAHLADPAVDPADDTDVILNASVSVDQGSLAGYWLDVHAAFSPQSRWVFARSADRPLPKPTGPDAMALLFVHNFLRQGVFVDLTQFDFEDLISRLEPEITEDDMPDDFRAELKADLGMPPEQAPRTGFNMHGDARIRVTGPSTDPDTGARTPGTLSLGMTLGGPDTEPFGQFLSQLLTGRAGPAQFDQFRQMVEGAGGAATVEPMGNDRFLLTAMPDAASAQAACFSALQITYARDTGVELVELVGVNSGSIILTFLSDPIDPARLSPDALLGPNTLTVTPDLLNSFLPFLAPTPSPATDPADDSNTDTDLDTDTESNPDN